MRRLSQDIELDAGALSHFEWRMGLLTTTEIVADCATGAEPAQSRRGIQDTTRPRTLLFHLSSHSQPLILLPHSARTTSATSSASRSDLSFAWPISPALGEAALRMLTCPTSGLLTWT